MRAPIYLDHNASTPLAPEALAAMLPFLTDHFGNPSSGHAFGRRAREGVEAARAQVAAAIGAHADEIVFTSGATEASNLAILGTARARAERTHVVTSATEHPATDGPCELGAKLGGRVTRVRVDGSGVIDLEALAAALETPTRLVTIIHGHNETGVLQPLAEVAARAHGAGALVHADAAQSVGKVRVRVDELGVDLLSIAGHKLGAPKGVGALYVRRGTAIAALFRGADHERGLRPGTENVASIVALGAACAATGADLDAAALRMRSLRDELWVRLERTVPGIVQNGDPDRRLPSTLSVRFPRVRGAALLARVPEIAAATGSACHDGNDGAPAAIVAMGIPAAEAVGTVRLSVGRTTSLDEVEEAADLLAGAWRAIC